MAESIEAEAYLWLYDPPHHDKVYLSQVIKGENNLWYQVTAYARRGQPLNTRRREFTHGSLAFGLHTRTVAEKQAKGYVLCSAADVLKGGGPAPGVTVVVKEAEPALIPKTAAPTQRKIWDLDDEP